MRQTLTFITFALLVTAGALRFAIDVVSQYLRGVRAPGPETTLYYGLHSAYALGLVLFGLLGLVVARQAPAVFSQWPALVLCAAAAAGWLALAFCFIEYGPPKFWMGVFAILVLSMAVTR